MNKKTIKRIAIILILVTVFITINNTYFQAKSWASLPAIAPIAVEIALTILGMLGVTATATDASLENMNLTTMINSWLRKPGNEEYQMLKILADMGYITAKNFNKVSKKDIIEKFIEVFANVTDGDIDSNENGIADNKVINFKDAETKNLFVSEIIKDLNRNGLLEEKRKIIEYFSADEWFMYSDSPRTSIAYPYRYIVEEKIFSTPLDGLSETDWEAIESFPFATFGDKIIIKNSPGYHVYKFPYAPYLDYKSYTGVYVGDLTVIEEWQYDKINKIWSYQQRECKGTAKPVYSGSTNNILYCPYNIYEYASVDVKRQADELFIDKGMEVKTKLVCSNLPMGIGENIGLGVKEYELKNGIWTNEMTYTEYYVKGDIQESNYDIKTKENEIYFKRTAIRNESDLSDVNLPATNPFTAETEVQPKVWSDESSAISVVSTDIAKEYATDELSQQTVNDVLTNDNTVAVDTTIGDVISYNPPYDDTQARQELRGIAGWLNMIWTSIQQGVGSIVEAINAQPSGSGEEDITEDVKEYKINDIFLCVWDVLTACIRLILRAGVYLTTLFDVEADDSYLNENLVLGINRIKNIEMPEPFGVSFWNVVSGMITLLFSLSIVRRAREFI